MTSSHCSSEWSVEESFLPRISLKSYSEKYPLSKFLPGLIRLVFGSSYEYFDHSHGILDLRQSGWLENSPSELTVEFMFGQPGGVPAYDVGLDTSPFRSMARCVPGGLWNDTMLNAKDLMCRWDDEILGFAHSSYLSGVSCALNHMGGYK